MEGIVNRFCTVNSTAPIQKAETNNYPATSVFLDEVEKQILTELSEGRYAKLYNKPMLISALNALEKPTDDVRHDCSQPEGQSVNADEFDRVKYQSVKDATSLITEGCYFAKVDLKYTYRSIPLHPSQYKYTVFKWKFKGDNDFTYLYDRCLCFGARLAPGIFHRISQFIRQMMARRWFKGIAYLDDFLIVEKSKERCALALKTLISLLQSLGLVIAWEKVEGPTTTLTFLEYRA